MIVSLLPHSITLRLPDGSDVEIPPSGAVARVSSTPGAVGVIDGIPVPVAGRTTFGPVTGVPIEQPGTWFLVSGLVGAALQGRRDDVLVPGTGPDDGAVRVDGKVVAVTRLVRA